MFVRDADAVPVALLRQWSSKLSDSQPGTESGRQEIVASNVTSHSETKRPSGHWVLAGLVFQAVYMAANS